MKNSTFSAQVANNLLTLLQGYTKGIRLIALLTMLCTIGVGQMWGAELTEAYSYTFTSKTFSDNATAQQLGTITWTPATSWSVGTGYWGYDGTKGQQWGSGSHTLNTMVLTSGTSFENVKKITINASIASSGGCTLSVKVGSTTIGSSKSLTTTATNYDFESATGLNGTISITLSNGSKKKAQYIKSITIYTEASTPATPYTVTFDAGSGNSTESLTETSAGAGVTLPTPTIDCGEWSFAGWAEAAVANQTTTAPTTLFKAGDNYKPAEDCTLYAVYTKTETSQGGGTTTVTSDLSFSNTNQRTSYSTSQQVWTQNGITLTNDKAGSTSNVGDYSDPARFYESSSITVTAPGNITQIEFNCVSGYVISITGASTSGTTVTVTLNGTSDTYIVSSLSAQVRLTSLSVTYTTTSAGGTITTTYYHSTPDCGGSTPDPDPTYYTITLNPNYPAGKKGTFIDTVGNAVDGDLKISWLGETETTPIAKLYSSISLDGYIFEGWYEITAEGEKNRKNTGTITSDTTFHARWKVPYTVTFNAGTGSCDKESITETTANGITLPTATLENCNDWTFLGWAENAIESETTEAPASILYGGSTYKPTTNIPLYAIYKRVEGGGGESATLTFDDTSKRTTRTTNQQVWTENGITLTNNKSESTDTVAAYYNPVRFYKSSEIIIEAPENITQIAATTSGISYATALKSSVGTEASANESVVTIAPTESNTTYTIQLTGGQVRLSSITVTYGGSPSTSYFYSNPVCGSTPTLTVNPTSLAFGNVTVNSNKEMTFTLTGSDLTANAALALSGANASMFSVNPTSVTQSAGSIDQTITVTYAPTAAGNHTATLTISSTDAESKTVTLSGVGSNPPTWQPATINFEGIIQVACGSTTVLNPADPNNGPATITFNGYDLQDSVKVTASEGFLVSTDKTTAGKYTTELTVNPHKDGNNIGKIQNVYVIAQAPAQSGDYDGTITLTGTDITGGSQVINVTADVTCTTYTITWSVDGDTELIAPTTFYAGGDWTLPENPIYECNGREFVGWTNTEIVQPQDIAPNVLYKEKGDFPTIESDITFYAVFAQEGTGDGSGTATVTDVLNREWTEVSGTTYKDWNGKTATSSAVYAGNSAGGNESIQLRSDKSSAGIITTTSGGKARKVTVVWNTNTASGRVLNIYGKNSAYSAATDLYGNNAGTLIGSITYNTSTTLTIDSDYEYIGIRSNSGALYLTSISIQWETDGEGDGNATTYTSYTTSCADVKAIRIVEPRTKTFNEGDKFVFDGEVWAINSDDTETNVTNSSFVYFTYDMNKVGEQTVTVSYLGFTATYEITINAVEKWQITWNVSGTTNTGLSPATVVKEQAIGKLPNPKAIPDGCEGKTFVGWTESNTVNSDGTEITFITSSTVPTQNTTYYAVFATPSVNAGDGGYVKLTETPADLSGEYLIVYEAGNLAFNGGLGTLDAVNNTISVTISNNTIASTDATNAAKFTITKNGDAYIITSASNYHIGQTSDANGLQSSTSTSYTNTITITDGNANIISGGAYLRFNSASNQNRFRYYSSSTYTNQKSIALYKKSGSSASYTDYTTGCHDVTITYYGFTGGYTTNCDGSDLNVITTRVNSAHTIPSCADITDPTTLGRKFLNLWKDQNGKTYEPGTEFIVTDNITLYAQWALNTSENTTLPTDVEDLATTDIIVTGGTTLTLQAGTTTINSLTLKGGLQEGGSYAMPTINVPNNATLVRKDSKIHLDLTVNNQSYYPFAVPFEVQNIKANIHYLDERLNDAATYGDRGHYQVLTYDGGLRAENGLSDKNWVHVGRHTAQKPSYLVPGKGYAISAVPAKGETTTTIRISMDVDDDWFAGGEQISLDTITRNQIAVTAHTGAAADKDLCNAGWNFVANPYLTNFAANNISGAGYINGQIVVNNGKFEHNEEEIPYVTIPNANMSWYDQCCVSDAKLSPMYSFFVQIGTGGTMTFTTAGRQQAPAALRASSEHDNPSFNADIVILNSQEQEADHTGLVINDRWSPAYEIGGDLEKMFGNANRTAIYTLSGNTRLAYNALSYNDALVAIPVGFRAQADGEYTIQLSNTEDIVGVECIELKDLYNNQTTNLLYTDYTFYTDATQDDSRFVVYIVPQKNTPTDISTITNGNTENGKIIFNNHLYIIHNGNVYNGNGQIVK